MSSCSVWGAWSVELEDALMRVGRTGPGEAARAEAARSWRRDGGRETFFSHRDRP